MIGLIKKDFLVIIKSIKFLYLLPLLAPVFVAAQNPRIFMPLFSFVISMLLATFVTETMSADEAANWYRNVSAMPVAVFIEAYS
jgi:sterol desaturase/sphingolipid hydroxylase (fatty acid hydroxylase superfamily)